VRRPGLGLVAVARAPTRRVRLWLRVLLPVCVCAGGALAQAPPLPSAHPSSHPPALDTPDMAQASIDLRLSVYVEPRDDVFQFDVLLQVHNPGPSTWLPNQIGVRLPAGWKAFSPAKAHPGAPGLRSSAPGVWLHGPVKPGTHNASFRFQVPNDQSPTAAFRLTLPPRVSAVQVVTEASPNMGLQVGGYSAPTAGLNTHGRRVLKTGAVARPGDWLPSELSITLTGLPTSGDARWWALIAALLIAGAGVVYARQYAADDQRLRRDRQRLREARELLLAELIDVHQARLDNTLGPRAYDSVRSELVDALARIELMRQRTRKPPRAKPR
jgi:hypothetical protein